MYNIILITIQHTIPLRKFHAVFIQSNCWIIFFCNGSIIIIIITIIDEYKLGLRLVASIRLTTECCIKMVNYNYYDNRLLLCTDYSGKVNNCHKC